MIRFALAGNPNSGKTTLFNSLTGSTAHVGNWPGVTVEKRSGTYKKLEEPIDIVDLPGIYSLSPYTSEEIISRNYLIDEHPDLIIDVVDATNLERNLYLTTQLLEIDLPIVVALNMIDVLEKNGTKINIKMLEEKLGVPVVEVSALKESNLDKLMKRALKESKSKREGYSIINHQELKHLIGDVTIAFKGQGVDNPLFHAIKLVENDEFEIKNHQGLIKMVDAYKTTINDEVFGADFEAIIADNRYQFITENLRGAVLTKTNTHIDDEKIVTTSDKIDKVLTHKVFGLFFFAIILFVVFHFTFSSNLFIFPKFIFQAVGVGDSLANTPYSGLFWTADGINSPGVILFNLVDMTSSLIIETLKGFMDAHLGANLAWITGLTCDGILSGIFAILGFLPQILLLFLFFSIMEDSGYMARVAFIFDKMFRKLGLSGRAFIPMIMGFGCSVPAMVNTRTLNDDKEKTATIRVIPFFSCGAKLPILTAIAGGISLAFGFKYVDVITYSMYVVGIVVALIAVLLMRNTTLKGENSPFMMELPNYHLPQFKALMIHLWDKAKHFIQKAFTIILASTIIIWFLTHFSFDWHYLGDAMDQSILAGLGKLIQPLFTPLGFGVQLTSFGWVFAVAAITGLIAKENVIATFTTLAAVFVAGIESGSIDPSIFNAMVEVDGEMIPVIDAVRQATESGESLTGGLSESFLMIAGTGISWQGCISFIAFNMLTIPCFAAVATAKGELPKGKFAWTLLFWVVTSYIASASIYAVLSCFTTDGYQLAWAIPSTVGVIVLAALTVVGVIIYNKILHKKSMMKGA